jgi:LPS sulfotransferase NodH
VTTPPFLTDEGQPRAFIIVSSARSGSNLLVGYLRQVQRAACFGEILRSEFPDRAGWDKLVKRLELPPNARRLHAEDAAGFWELCLRQSLRRRRFAGAKIFYYHRHDEAIWDRFAAPDHLVLHLWRDATFDQYVSRALAAESGQWKGRDDVRAAEPEPRVTFDVDEYLAYRAMLRKEVAATRARYGGSGRYEEIEYRQLSDHAFVADLLERHFGERIEVEEILRQQRRRPKIEYVRNPEDAEPFVNDRLSSAPTVRADPRRTSAPG